MTDKPLLLHAGVNAAIRQRIVVAQFDTDAGARVAPTRSGLKQARAAS